jgi:hypothetical protein
MSAPSVAWTSIYDAARAILCMSLGASAFSGGFTVVFQAAGFSHDRGESWGRAAFNDAPMLMSRIVSICR